ncbi:MAG: TRAP transporter small permease [Alphaproteobacteria bacterium]|nr:TRAP transporter small permease [Alphaproteobacteria bacterium]
MSVPAEGETRAGAAAGGPRRFSLERWMLRISEGMAVLGGLAATAVGLLITASVLRRWLFDQPVPGDFELAQMLTAVAVFAFLPVCQLKRGNIIVDFFTATARPRTRHALDCVSCLLFAVFALLICVGTARGAADAFRSHTTTMVLGVPTGYAMSIGAVCTAWLVVVSLYTAAREGITAAVTDRR